MGKPCRVNHNNKKIKPNKGKRKQENQIAKQQTKGKPNRLKIKEHKNEM